MSRLLQVKQPMQMYARTEMHVILFTRLTYIQLDNFPSIDLLSVTLEIALYKEKIIREVLVYFRVHAPSEGIIYTVKFSRSTVANSSWICSRKLW